MNENAGHAGWTATRFVRVNKERQLFDETKLSDGVLAIKSRVLVAYVYFSCVPEENVTLPLRREIWYKIRIPTGLRIQWTHQLLHVAL